MDVGLAHFLTDYGMQPVELARKVEERGFESLFLPEHTHIPASRDTPNPGGGELPPEYSHTLDPFAALAAIAAVTDRIKIGTGVCLVIQRDPIVTAKEVATVDQISGGRFLFGVGAGWNREEMENHGTDYRTRFTRMRESVEAMKAIWTEDEAEYHGKIVDFDPIWCWPKPAQRPHPPVLVGGVGEKVIDRVLAGHPDQWALLAERPELAPAAVEELLRYEPITPFTARLLHEEVEYRGVTFPADSIVMVCSFAGNRDGVEGDPEAFDISADRGDAKPLTFGAGIHYCLGANLARAELQEALAFLPARMPGLALDGEAELGSIHGIYGLERLPISWS